MREAITEYNVIHKQWKEHEFSLVQIYGLYIYYQRFVCVALFCVAWCPFGGGVIRNQTKRRIYRSINERLETLKI